MVAATGAARLTVVCTSVWVGGIILRRSGDVFTPSNLLTGTGTGRQWPRIGSASPCQSSSTVEAAERAQVLAQNEEWLAILQEPGALEDIRSIMGELLEDPERRATFNGTINKLRKTAEKDGVGVVGSPDPLVDLLGNPQAFAAFLADPSGSSFLASALSGESGRGGASATAALLKSDLLQELQALSGEVVSRLRVRRLRAGAWVVLRGLQAQPELNGRVGVLAEPTPEEAAAFEGRRIAVVDGQRLALLSRHLELPQHMPGEAVILRAEFAGEEEGLEGRLALVSELTQEEAELGFASYRDRVVVDVLPLLPGGPIVHRLLMRPEHLQPRPWQEGDAVCLSGLDGDAPLNGESGAILELEREKQTATVLLANGGRLAVRTEHLRLTRPTE